MILITLSGTDGSGKSTQLALLRDYFERMGKKIAYFHAVEFSLANRWRRKASGETEFTSGKDAAVTRASFASLFLRRLFLVIDLFRFRFLLNSLRKDGTDILLSDRYFYDSFINIDYLSGSKNARCLALKMIPRPDTAFFLDATPEAIMRRERVPEQGIDYITAKRDLFMSKRAEWNLVRIDANRTKEEVYASILETLNR
ncbi:MAG: hypothetical protein WCL23_01415 [Candidatus Moraniibacteriota bacterium]